MTWRRRPARGRKTTRRGAVATAAKAERKKKRGREKTLGPMMMIMTVRKEEEEGPREGKRVTVTAMASPSPDSVPSSPPSREAGRGRA